MTRYEQLNATYAKYRLDPSRYLDQLLTDVRRIVVGVIDCEDQVQKFLVYLWSVLPKLNLKRASFATFVLRTAKLRNIDGHRERIHHDEFEVPLPSMLKENGEPASNEEVLDALAMDGYEEDAYFDFEQIGDPVVREAAQQLLIGYTQTETAERMGMQESALKMRLKRFRDNYQEQRLAA